MSALKDINMQIYSSLEKEYHALENLETVNLIENSFSGVENIISKVSNEIVNEEVNDVARNTILICTLSYKVASWLPELSLNTWRRYISYLKEFSQIISEPLAKEMWQCLIRYFREEINYMRQLYEHRSSNASDGSSDETIKNSIKLLLYLAQRLSASIFFFSIRFLSLECAQSIYLLCTFHSLLQDMTSYAGPLIEEKSRLNFHKAFCTSSTSGSGGSSSGNNGNVGSNSGGQGGEDHNSATKRRYLQLLSSMRDPRAYVAGSMDSSNGSQVLRGALALLDSEMEMLLGEACHSETNNSSIVSCFIVCMEVFVTALAHVCMHYSERQISDSLIQDNMSRLVTRLQASALTFSTQLWGTVLGVAISQSLCSVRRPNPHSFGIAQRSVSIIYSCVLCLFSSLQEQRSKEAIVDLVWRIFEQIHLTSSMVAGFDSRYILAVQAVRRIIMAVRLPGMPTYITEPFLSAHECCNHRQELFCPCIGGAAAVTSARAAAVEVLFTYMPVDCMALSTQCLNRHIERCLDCVKEASNPGAVSCKSVGLALSFLLSVLRHPSSSSSATAQLLSKHKAAYLGHVGIGTNILNWIKVLGDYIKKASSTNSTGFQPNQSNNANHTHTHGMHRLQRMQNIILVIGKLSLMLGPRTKVPAGVQSILLDISLSLAGFLTGLVDMIREDYAVLQKRRNSPVGVVQCATQTICMWEGLWETVLVSCDVALTCAETVKNILSIGFAGASSSSPVPIAERYLRVTESLVAACGVSGAPVNLTWRLWSIIIEGAYASKSFLRVACQGEGMQRLSANATVNNVNLPLLLKICEDRDNLSSHTYMHEDTTTSSIIDFLDLFTL